MRRIKLVIAVAAVMVAMIVVAAAPAMAKGNNAVKEERGETPRQQANEENHFNNFVGFNSLNGCFDFNCGLSNENGFFNTDFENGDFENCDFGFENCGFPFSSSFGLVDDNNFFNNDDFENGDVENGVFQQVG
jgi:hypothetical protein